MDDAADKITGNDGTGDLVSPSDELTANDPADGVINDLGDMELFDGAANAAVSAAETQADVIEKDANDIKDATQTAANNINTGIGAINTATSIADANSAYAAVQAEAQTINTNFDQALADYNSSIDAYNKQVEYVAALEKAHNDELEAANDGVYNFDLKLKEAKEKADALKVAADNAAANLDQYTQNMVEIGRLIGENDKNTSVNWQKDDGLRETFKKVVLFYYATQAGIMTKDEVLKLQSTPGFDIDKFITSVERKGAKGSIDSTLTYHWFEYNGKAYYLNHILNGTKGANIFIFEKRPEEIMTPEELDKLGFDKFDTYKDKDGKVVDVNDKSVVEADQNNDGVNDLYVKLIGEGDTKGDITKVGDVLSADDKEETRILSIGDEEKVSYAYDENTKELVKTVTKGATTVVYRQQSKPVEVESSVMLNEEDAQAKLKEALAANLKNDGVTEYDKVEVGTVTNTQEWKAIGSYKPVFKGKTTIVAKYDEGFDAFTSKATIRTKAENDSANILATTLTNQGQKLVGDPVYQNNDYETETYFEDVPYTIDLGFLGTLEGTRKEKRTKRIDYTTKPEWHPLHFYDGNWFSYWTAERTANYEYTDSTTGSVTGTGETADDAIANANSQINNYKQTYKNAVDIQNRNVSDAQLNKVTYSAWLTYWQKVENSESTETTGVVVEKTIYSQDEISKLTGSIEQNKIYWDYINDGTYHESLLSYKDLKAKDSAGNDIDLNRGLNEAIQKAEKTKEKYDNLRDSAVIAADNYQTALEAVEDLKIEIGKIDTRNTTLFGLGKLPPLAEMELPELIDYLQMMLQKYGYSITDDGELVPPVDREIDENSNETKLMDSLLNLLKAADNMTGIQDLLVEAEDELGAAIARLTPPVTTPAPGTTPETTGETPTGAGPGAAGVAGAGAVTTPFAFMGMPGTGIGDIAAGAGAGAGAGGAEGAGGAGAGVDAADADLTDIDEAPIPLDMTPEEAKDIVDTLKNITDSVVPLEEGLPDQNKVGYWWWLLFVLFGGAAYALYQQYKNRQTQKEETSQNDNETK